MADYPHDRGRERKCEALISGLLRPILSEPDAASSIGNPEGRTVMQRDDPIAALGLVAAALWLLVRMEDGKGADARAVAY